MTDNIYGVIEDCKCPECGSKKLVFDAQVAVQLEMDMNGKIIRRHPITGKRMNLSNQWLAGALKYGHEIETGVYVCKKCGWQSEPYTT